MKIIYLTWGETPRSYGVFNSQVIGQFIETRKAMLKDNFYFISAIPIVNSGFVREKWGYLDEYKKVKKNLEDNHIKFSSIPIYFPQNFVNSTKATFSLMHIGSQWHLKNKFKKINPDIVHCRSYHSAWAALKVREKYNFSYKIVFDARGLWPDEIALKKGFDEEGEDYLFFKSIEKELLEKCDISVTVSDTMKMHFEVLNAKQTECIYLSTSVEKLIPESYHSKNLETINFVYVGALSDSTWHKPKELLSLYLHIRSILKNTKLTIVTTSSHTQLEKYFKDIPQSEITFTSTKTIDELKSILEQSDFGLMSYFNPSTDREKVLSSMVLAVKTAEYLAAGLPLIVNKFCGGASYIIEKENIGIAYDPSTFVELSKEKILLLYDEGSTQRASEFASQAFDYSVNAEKYKKLYTQLMIKI